MLEYKTGDRVVFVADPKQRYMRNGGYGDSIGKSGTIVRVFLSSDGSAFSYPFSYPYEVRIDGRKKHFFFRK